MRDWMRKTQPHGFTFEYDLPGKGQFCKFHWARLDRVRKNKKLPKAKWMSELWKAGDPEVRANLDWACSFKSRAKNADFETVTVRFTRDSSYGGQTATSRRVLGESVWECIKSDTGFHRVKKEFQTSYAICPASSAPVRTAKNRSRFHGDLLRRMLDVERILGNMVLFKCCLLYTSPSPRDATLSRMPSSA